MVHTNFKPDRDIPDLSGKVILVTGGNSGLGAESCLRFAEHNPAEIYLGARSKAKAEQAIASIKETSPNAKITFLEMDLTNLASVKAAAESFMASSKRLDVLMNNAGIMACPADLTADGFEIQFGTNHVGHFLLTKILLPVLQETAKLPDTDVRIVNISSRGHKFSTKGLLLEDACTDMSSYNTFTRYGQSKIANIFFTQELAKRYPGIRCVSLHPEDVNTNLVSGFKKSWPWVPDFVWNAAGALVATNVQQGALNQLWASVSPDVRSGEYYDPVGKIGSISAPVKDASNAPKLWKWTEMEMEKRGY
ncbi:hypothetical protein AAFC00_000786 [Neodothiora populina]|uniref:NAD(P)-binding protein n=1 Tax=Neodothiora populina TaxID=2781224 RepID=A0ABR3PLT7_9PEZI